MALPAILARLAGGALYASLMKKYGKKIGQEADKMKEEKRDKEFKKLMEKRKLEREKKEK
jgi:hypothetical protein